VRLFSDQKTLLLNTYNESGAIRAPALADEAIAQAYRKIGGITSWAYLHRRTQINTNAPYSTGTITYVASTRIMTLTGGTWPSWTGQALILLSQSAYAVQQVIDSTHILLTPDRSPVTDITTQTAYVAMQSEYQLPANWIRMEEIVMMGTVWSLYPVEPGSMLSMTRFFFSPSRPWQYLTRGSTYFEGRMAMEFGPPPNYQYTYDMSYYAQPRQRTLPGPVSGGTVTVNGTAVVGNNTAFTQSMVGCRLRQGTTTAVPVGEYGTAGSTAENTIATVTDSTHLTLVDAGQSSSGVQYLIDDPIDIDRQSMDEVFCRICEYEFAVLIRLNSREEKRQEMIQAIKNAQAMDVRMSPKIPQYMIPTWDMIARANMQGT
jgi:hypothetical protein